LYPNQAKPYGESNVQTIRDEEERPRINEEIRTFKIRVIDHNGNNLGVINNRDALYKAREAGFDLVEVSPQATPPVCKIMDFGKYMFELKKKRKDNEHKSPETKEIRLTPAIGQGDLEIKARKALEFLEEGSKVILSFKLRGREASKTEFVKDVVARFYAIVETKSTLESKGGVHILTPKV
jgi:translation initiation factor IF-3